MRPRRMNRPAMSVGTVVQAISEEFSRSVLNGPPNERVHKLIACRGRSQTALATTKNVSRTRIKDRRFRRRLVRLTAAKSSIKRASQFGGGGIIRPRNR